jgi:predicted nucleic acid-binding Zn ribbon protein
MGNIMDELDYIYICDECDTLATVIQQGNTITITQCECVSKENK